MHHLYRQYMKRGRGRQGILSSSYSFIKMLCFSWCVVAKYTKIDLSVTKVQEVYKTHIISSSTSTLSIIVQVQLAFQKCFPSPKYKNASSLEK